MSKNCPCVKTKISIKFKVSFSNYFRFSNAMSLREHSIPVFIYPNELVFYAGSHSTHKQLLTLYNPYDFPVKYQVFANTVEKYSVVDPKGAIASKSSVDLLIRHNVPTKSNHNSRDKFMITMLDASTNKFLGKRCIVATLLPGDGDSGSISDEGTHSYSAFESSQKKVTHSIQSNAPSKYYFSIILLFLFIIFMMPTKCDEEKESSIPSYLYVSVTVKMTFVFMLGFMTHLVISKH